MPIGINFPKDMSQTINISFYEITRTTTYVFSYEIGNLFLPEGFPYFYHFICYPQEGILKTLVVVDYRFLDILASNITKATVTVEMFKVRFTR